MKYADVKFAKKNDGGAVRLGLESNTTQYAVIQVNKASTHPINNTDGDGNNHCPKSTSVHYVIFNYVFLLFYLLPRLKIY